MNAHWMCVNYTTKFPMVGHELPAKYPTICSICSTLHNRVCLHKSVAQLSLMKDMILAVAMVTMLKLGATFTAPVGCHGLQAAVALSQQSGKRLGHWVVASQGQ
jgi:hypothetical protein